MEEKIIMRVWENKGNKQLSITIPKRSRIRKGDYVEIRKVELDDK